MLLANPFRLRRKLLLTMLTDLGPLQPEEPPEFPSSARISNKNLATNGRYRQLKAKENP